MSDWLHTALEVLLLLLLIFLCIYPPVMFAKTLTRRHHRP